MDRVLTGLLLFLMTPLAVVGGAFFVWGIGYVYFIRSSRTSSLIARLATSAFGPSLAVVFCATAIFCSWHDPSPHQRLNAVIQAFSYLQAIPLFFLGLSLARYSGPRYLHFLLVPMGLLAWAWMFALGWFFIIGD